MLSRDADSCYWIGRYIERSEATARMVDVHYHAALETFIPSTTEHRDEDMESPLKWASLLEISGNAKDFSSRYSRENDRDVLNYFCFDLKNHNSIASTWKSARENARSMREQIASEMWESVNISYLKIKDWDVDRLYSQTPHEFFTLVKNASHLFQGILNRTMVMGETRDWLDLGRFSERADQTARLIDVKCFDLFPERTKGEYDVGDTPSSGNPLDLHEWIAVLKSVSAFEMYRKTHLHGIKPVSIVNFLVLNYSFPASIRHCTGRVNSCLHRISGSGESTACNEPERLVGRLLADLTFISPEEIISSGLHEFLEDVQSQWIKIGMSIAATYLTY
jgi:uncharacterized alpha-E superfamily protein